MADQGRPSARPSDTQLAYLTATLGRAQIGKALGVAKRTVDRWCQDAQDRPTAQFGCDDHPTATAMIDAIEEHHRSLIERVPELVDAMVTKCLAIIESEVLDARTATDQLALLLEILSSGKFVPVPTAEHAGAITDNTREDLLARVMAATASSVQRESN